MRPEHHLRPCVTCHDVAHHGKSAGLSQNVRLSATRRLVGDTPGLPNQRLELVTRHHRKLALSKIGDRLRTKTEAPCQRFHCLDGPSGGAGVDRHDRSGCQAIGHQGGGVETTARQRTTFVMTPIRVGVTNQIDRCFSDHRPSTSGIILVSHGFDNGERTPQNDEGRIEEFPDRIGAVDDLPWAVPLAGVGRWEIPYFNEPRQRRDTGGAGFVTSRTRIPDHHADTLKIRETARSSDGTTVARQDQRCVITAPTR